MFITLGEIKRLNFMQIGGDYIRRFKKSNWIGGSIQKLRFLLNITLILSNLWQKLKRH